MQTRWLDPPERGTAICLGFDGSDVDDLTALRAETHGGLQFTPRYGPNREPTIWTPAQWRGKVPRSLVNDAVDEVMETYSVRRMYADPPRWETDVDRWAARHGEDVVLEWATYRTKQMHEALERFRTDLGERRISHDGCPITALHMANARMLAKTSDRYLLAKPAQHQKIDAAMASVLAHEAAADAHVEGWSLEPADTRVIVFR